MKKLSVISMLLLSSISMSAQQRSEQEAIGIAREFLNQHTVAHAPRLKAVPRQQVSTAMARHRAPAVQPVAQQPGYYIVNDEANQRFVVVGADERMYDILGYSDRGTFSADRAPIQLFDVLGWYDGQQQLLASSHVEGKAPARESVEPVAPLITAKWGQESPYNDLCPADSRGNTSVTGCTATAMAQVMNCHKYPAQAQGGVLSYETKTEKIAQSMDFDAIGFDWSLMQDSYTSRSPQASKAEVAKLMHACGVSVHMDYGQLSSANQSCIPYALIHYFGYNPNMQYVVRAYYDDAEWNKMIQDELRAGRPVTYSGRGTTKTTIFGEVDESHASHQFVLDGMDANGLYHFDFGWEGECSGYFAIDAVHPSRDLKVLGINLSHTVYDFTEEQAMVMGISPQPMGEEADMFYAMELELETSVPVDTLTSITFNPLCCANKCNKEVSFSGQFGLGIFDKDWTLVKTLCDNNEEVSTLHAGGYFRRPLTTTFTYDATTFQEGSQYYLALYAQHADSKKPTLVRTLNGEKDWYRVTVADGMVSLASRELITDDTPIGKSGDVNGDYVVDVADIDCIIDIMAQIEASTRVGRPKPASQSAGRADVNGDGVVDVADIAAVARIIQAGAGK